MAYPNRSASSSKSGILTARNSPDITRTRISSNWFVCSGTETIPYYECYASFERNLGTLISQYRHSKSYGEAQNTGSDTQAKEQALGEAEEFVLKTLHHTVNHKLDFFYQRRASLRDAADTAYETMNRMGWCVKAFSPMCTLCEAITACWLHLTTFAFGALPDRARLQVPLPASEVPHMNLLITPVFTSLKTFLFSQNELFSTIFPDHAPI
jgi:hypothetical protein